MLLLRNVGMLLSLLKLPLHFGKAINPLWVCYKYQQFVGLYLFVKLRKVLIPHIHLFKYAPIGVNYPTSAHFRALACLETPLKLKWLWCTQPNDPNHLSSYLKSTYMGSSQVYLVTLTHKPVKVTLFKLLLMSMSCWFSWSRKYVLPSQCFTVSAHWYLLTFLNVYFFKIYNI